MGGACVFIPAQHSDPLWTSAFASPAVKGAGLTHLARRQSAGDREGMATATGNREACLLQVRTARPREARVLARRHRAADGKPCALGCPGRGACETEVGHSLLLWLGAFRSPGTLGSLELPCSRNLHAPRPLLNKGHSFYEPGGWSFGSRVEIIARVARSP